MKHTTTTLQPPLEVISTGYGYIITETATAREVAFDVPDVQTAKLFAAAPWMLDALETIAMGNTDPDEMVEIAAAAVAKAKGE